RFGGYVGAIGAEGAMHGERFASLSDELNLLLGDLAKRGLLYVDPRPGAAPLPLVWQRTIDRVIDEQETPASIAEALQALVKRAKEKGSALGLVGVVRPRTTQLLADWASGLAADGLALAPVSALVQAPATP